LSASFEPDEINLEGLEKLTKALKQKNPPVIQIGVIGSPPRKSQGKSMPTNAEIGAVHEYGSPVKGIPPRSWLRMPLSLHLQEAIDASQLLGEKALEMVMRSGSIIPWLEDIKILALATVKKGFATGGWGTWVPWKPGYENNTGLKLVDTRGLRDSVDARIAKEAA
jgi:hypothetical protein